MNANKDENIICYEKSLQYWSAIPPTVDGVLGGLGFISDIDIDGSAVFLKSLLTSANPPSLNTALDCGAGIGRTTKLLLMPHFQTVDAVEPVEKFINSIKEFVGEYESRLGTLYKAGLQEFRPVKKYDVIWNQWVLGYLTEKDLVDHFTRCRFDGIYCCSVKSAHDATLHKKNIFRESLNENGVIVVKENVTSSGKVEKDYTDASVTRSLKQYLRIFKLSNLEIIKQCKQAHFPKFIYPVYMFALIPNGRDTNTLSEISS